MYEGDVEPDDICLTADVPPQDCVSPGALTTVGNLDTLLNPGESITCTADYSVTADDVVAGSVTNTAMALAGGVFSNQDQETATTTP